MRPTAHTRKETEPFAEELSNTSVPQLHEVYKAIFQEHCNGDIVYALNMMGLWNFMTNLTTLSAKNLMTNGGMANF